MADGTRVAGTRQRRGGWQADALSLVSVRRTDLRGGLAAAALVLRLTGAGLLAWTGYVHWLLWHLYYSGLPVNGPLFLLDAIAGALLAVVLLAWPRPLIGLLSAGFVVTTIGALLVSLNFGLFGFRESTTGPFVGQALVLESAAVVILAAWTVIAAGIAPRRR